MICGLREKQDEFTFLNVHGDPNHCLLAQIGLSSELRLASRWTSSVGSLSIWNMLNMPIDNQNFDSRSNWGEVMSSWYSCRTRSRRLWLARNHVITNLYIHGLSRKLSLEQLAGWFERDNQNYLFPMMDKISIHIVFTFMVDLFIRIFMTSLATTFLWFGVSQDGILHVSS